MLRNQVLAGKTVGKGEGFRYMRVYRCASANSAEAGLMLLPPEARSDRGFQCFTR